VLTLRGLPVATITLARDAGEEARIGRALAALASRGARISVADGGSPPRFLAALDTLPNLTRCAPSAPGMIAQVEATVRAATASASDARYILYTEPDKAEFFVSGLGDFLTRASAHSDADVIVAARSAAALATFPPVQRQAETFASTLCGRVTGVPGDYIYGPFLFDRRVAAFVTDLPRDLGWGWRPRLFTAAARRGHRIAVVEGDYCCPEDQVGEAESDRAHRRAQLAQNLFGIAQGMQAP
jgi:hypothetical protein